jgi:hypothetical protein
MTQVAISNISLSFLRNQLNITESLSFSQLYNYSTDINKINSINISKLIGKYRTFIPTDLSNLIGWYDANTIFNKDYLNNNIIINNWSDISGNNNNAYLTNDLYQPYYLNCGLNGKPTVSFMNSSSLRIKPLVQTNAITIAIVFNTAGILKSNFIFSCEDIIIKHTSRSPVINVSTNNNYMNIISSFKYLDNVPNIYIASIYIDTDGYTKSQLNYNGITTNVYVHDNSLTTLNISNIFIGGFHVTNSLNGNISELLIYNNKFDSCNINYLEGYLSAKWWGVPSYLLPSYHLYNNISVLNPKSPIFLYNFDASSITSNIFLINNYGLQSYYLNGIIDNTIYYIKSSYYSSYKNHLNDLFIWYKFDENVNINSGYSGSPYNLIISSGNNPYTSDYIRGSGSLLLSNTDIATTNINANLINFGTFSPEYTIAFWYKVTAFINSGDTLFSLSGAPNNGSKFFIQRDGSTNNIAIGIPFSTNNIIIPNALYHDDIWRHISICLKKINNNNLLISVYLNGIIIINNLLLNGSWFSSNYNNYIVLNQYSTGSGIYNMYGANMIYDDFRFYTKCLTGFQVQSIMGYPISRQYGDKNTYGYLWNSYNTNSLDINNNLSINYLEFTNAIFNFNTNDYLTISYNLKILPDILYESDYEINILHCNDNNNDKLKIIHRFFINKTNYIKLIINDNKVYPCELYFPNNLNINISQNYIFKIPFKNTGVPDVIFYANGIINNNIMISDSSITEPIINQQFVKIGSYNNSLNNIKTTPYIIEDFKIYNINLEDSVIYYNNSNFNLLPSYEYYTSNIYPFNNILLNNCDSSSNAYGPTYNNLISNYSNNGSWIYNSNYINVNNGVQKFVIPKSGYYSIIAAGACGGKSYTNSNVGYGIILKNYVYFDINDILYILVGQKGGNGTYSLRPNEYNLHGQGGGGGGTYIVKYTSNTYQIILIAGGGGGSGEYMLNGVNSKGTDATYLTSGNLDSANTGVIAINGNGGNVGLYGVSKGSGIGGGGYYTDGINKLSIYGGVYSGICFLNVLNGSNIGKPYYQNYGGMGGFGGGATGGTNYSLDLVWGGGGGGGYSGGVGGGASYNQGQTHGGGGGGSYDINNITNIGTINKIEGINGFNNDNGYVKINFLTSYDFIYYANANKNIIKEGLTFLIEPFNTICYNYATSSSIINLVSGFYASLKGYYYYNNINKSIHLDNFSLYTDANNSLLHVNTFNTINTISIWYMILTEPIDNSCFIDTFNDFGHIYNNVIGADWNDGITDTTDGGIMYINSSTASVSINWSNLIYPLNVWKYITLISNSNLSNEIAFFNNDNGNGGINVEFGPIMVYNRIITSQEHLLNYYAYANIYTTSYEYYYNGDYQYFTVPPNIYKISVKCWGAGGGCGGYNNLAGSANGGAGIFISCIITVMPNDIIKIIVPSGGGYGKNDSISIGGYPSGGNGGFRSGAGGGFCAIMKNNEYLLIAAGGSGGGYYYGNYDNINTPSTTNNYTRGGNAGFLIGDNENMGLESGNYGTQFAGGIAYQIKTNNFSLAQNGQKYIGSSGGINYGGGSGQGYYSGSGGGEKLYFICGGAGSSSYVSSNCINVYHEIGDIVGNAPGNSDINYPSNRVGYGGAISSMDNGGNGYCIIKTFI